MGSHGNGENVIGSCWVAPRPTQRRLQTSLPRTTTTPRHRPADQAHAAAVRSLGQAGVMGVTTADVGTHRERVRQSKLRRVALILAPFAIWFVVRATVLHRGPFGFPHFPVGARRRTSRDSSSSSSCAR